MANFDPRKIREQISSKPVPAVAVTGDIVTSEKPNSIKEQTSEKEKKN